jgi:hypothetical protein
VKIDICRLPLAPMMSLFLVAAAPLNGFYSVAQLRSRPIRVHDRDAADLRSLRFCSDVNRRATSVHSFKHETRAAQISLEMILFLLLVRLL